MRRLLSVRKLVLGLLGYENVPLPGSGKYRCGWHARVLKHAGSELYFQAWRPRFQGEPLAGEEPAGVQSKHFCTYLPACLWRADRGRMRKIVIRRQLQREDDTSVSPAARFSPPALHGPQLYLGAREGFELVQDRGLSCLTKRGGAGVPKRWWGKIGEIYAGYSQLILERLDWG